MLKRKFFAVALPLVAGATIVGSGFAAWVFSQTESSNAGIGVEITEKVNIDGVKFKLDYETLNSENGTLSGTDKITLELDQGMNDFNGTELDKGISFNLNKGEKTLKLTKLKIVIDDENGRIKKLSEAGYTVNFGMNLTFDSTLLSYTDVKEQNDWSNIALKNSSNSEVYSISEVKVDPDTLKLESLKEAAEKDVFIDFSSTEEGTGKKFYHSNKLLSYKTWTGDDTTGVGKPQKVEHYTKMLNDFKGKGLVDESGKAGTVSALKLDLSLTIGEAN